MVDKNLNYGRHLIERFLRNAENPGVIVDLGAGGGDDLKIAGSICPGAALHAVEVYPPYAERLRAQGLTVHSVNIENDIYPFPDNSVDVIIANQIVEHLKEVFWVFHQSSRILKKGGSFIIGVPNIAALHNRLLLMLGKQPTQLKNSSAHVRGWSKDDLMNFLESCFPGGYALRDFGGSNFYPFPPVIAKPLASAFPNMAWGCFFRFVKSADYKDQFIQHPVRQQLETNFYLGKSLPE